jgi:hypothetical protein
MTNISAELPRITDPLMLTKHDLGAGKTDIWLPEWATKLNYRTAFI